MAELQPVEFGKQVRDLRRAIARVRPAIRAGLDMRPVERIEAELGQVTHRRRVVRARLDESAAERSTLTSEVSGLRKALEVLQGHTGIIQRGRIRHRITRHEARIAGLEAECAAFEQELFDLGEKERARRVVLVDALETCLAQAKAMEHSIAVEREAYTLADETPMWSPWPVIGYRVWRVDRDGLRGVAVRWEKPTLTAECARGSGVPHVDSNCSACGIYTMKDLDRLVTFRVPTQGVFVVGAVALSGKVVEHEFGYRAEVASVVAAVLCDDRELRTFVEPYELERLFATPNDPLIPYTLRRALPGWHSELAEVIAEELALVMPEEGRWT